jgi:hypothetical protein
MHQFLYKIPSPHWQSSKPIIVETLVLQVPGVFLHFLLIELTTHYCRGFLHNLSLSSLPTPHMQTSPTFCRGFVLQNFDFFRHFFVFDWCVNTRALISQIDRHDL